MGLTRPRFEQINSIITTISDPITVLNQGSTQANIDVGFIINRNGGALANTAIFWNESANTFVTAFTAASGATNANVSISEYANLRVNTLNSTFVNATGNILTAQLNAGQINTTGNIVSGGNVTVGNMIVPTGAGRFNGPFNESTTTAGVYVGNLNLSPRVGFFNGTASQNWQIDNNFGSFRWYTPGVVRMTIDTGGNLNVPSGNIMSAGNVTAPYFFGNGSQLSGVITSVTKIINGTSDVTAYSGGNIAVTVGGTANTVVFTSSNLHVAGSILPTANIAYDLGSPTNRFRTGYFSANTIDIGGGTIGLHDTLGFTFTTPGGNPQFMMPNGASTSNTFTSGTVTIQGNLAVNGNVTTIGNVSGQYILGSAQFLTGLPIGYSNINVKAYTESMGFQNYGNVNVAAYTQTMGYTNYSNVNVVAYLGSGAVTVGGNLTVQGNLIIQGTTTTVNSTTLDVKDLNITVAKGAASAAAANGAGLTVDGAGATLLYTSSTDSWNINKTFLSNSYINTTGNISADGNASASYFTGSGQFLTGINSFGNIFIAGQSPVLADNTSDTLTFVSGTGIAITANASLDTITIATVSTEGPFAASGDFGAVNEAVTVSEDEGSVADGATITYDLGSIISASGLIYPDQLVLPSYPTASLPDASVSAQLVFDSDSTSLKYSAGSSWTTVLDGTGNTIVTGNVTATGGWGGTLSSAGVLGGIPIAFFAERTSTGSAGGIMAHGNGSTTGKGLRMPYSGKLIAGTMFGANVNGTITIDAYLNGTANASYRFSQTGSLTDVGETKDFSSAPLTFAAGDTLGWYQTAVPTTANAYTVTFFVTYN